jgi:hypothetical protein
MGMSPYLPNEAAVGDDIETFPIVSFPCEKQGKNIPSKTAKENRK